MAGDTYVSSQLRQRLHLFDHRLVCGKETTFNTEICVPLIVAGHGVVPGWSNSQLMSSIDRAGTSNIKLAPERSSTTLRRRPYELRNARAQAPAGMVDQLHRLKTCVGALHYQVRRRSRCDPPHGRRSPGAAD